MTVSAKSAMPHQQETDYILLGENLLVLAQQWEGLEDILRAEIKFHGNIAKFSQFSNVNSASISKFLSKEATLGGEQTLEELSKACGSKYPELDNILLLIFEYKEKCGDKRGPLSISRPGVITFWSTSMDKMQKMNISKDVVAGQFAGFEKIVHNILVSKPALHCLKKFERNFHEIYPVFKELNWEAVKTSTRFNPQPQPKRAPEPPAPVEEISPVAQSAPHAFDSLNPHDQFVEIANRCIAKYGNKITVVKTCLQVGIAISETTFKKAYNRGMIAGAAESFIKLAPKLLLGEVTASTETEQPLTERAAPAMPVARTSISFSLEPEAALVSAEDFVPHDRKIADSEVFNMAFRSQLRATIAFLNEAIAASPQQREKIIAKLQPEISEAISGLQALSARNPKDILSMLSHHTEPAFTRPPGRRNRGSRGNR
ncbi:hypothetical protein IPM19_01800 [bacterium]|nr:MAG: hypothetical protein IPM19_01800 [bacterium]